MKRTLPLLAVLAATLTTPLAAQDMSSILNPGNFAANIGMSNSAFANLPRGVFQTPHTDARVRAALAAGQLAALTPEVALPEVYSLAPRTSLLPIRRGTIARVITPAVETAPVVTHVAPVVAPTQASDLVAAMAVAAEAAPAGANTLVVNGGTNTAVIQSGPSAVARPSLWQRLFGG